MRSQKIFRENVLRIVSEIPCGKVATYSAVAHQSGNIRAARAVGVALRQNFNPRIPCHRVIGSDGSLKGYNRGRTLKRRLLEREGVRFTSRGTILESDIQR